MQLITIAVFYFLVTIIETFQFTYPTVSANPLTINTLSTYQITMLRRYTATFAASAYDTEAVPANASISITFPSQYTLSGSQTCNFIVIDGALSSTATCSVDTVNNKVTFVNSLTADTFIATVQVQIGSVTNPSPATTTSPFMGQIGSDVTAFDSSGSTASVTLQKGTLSDLSITFSPTTVNSTSNMMITLVNTNPIPSTGSIRVKFPSTLYWTRDIAGDNNLIPIETISSCSPINNVYFLLSCSGNSTTEEVILTNVLQNQASAGTTLTFSINNIFSPPTTEEIDQITVTTFYTEDESSPIDSSTSTITGLTSQTMTFSISSTSTMTVNTFVALTLTITISDTITNDDVFQIRFPAGTTINYQTQFSLSFGLASNTSYDSANSILTFYQNSVTSTKYETFTGSLTFLNYLTPSSTKTTDPIEFAILNNGFEKMVGTDTITAVVNSYDITISSSGTQINTEGSYTLSFNLQNSLTSSGYIEITMPTSLSLNLGFTVSLNGDSTIVSSPTASETGGVITLTNLNSSASDIGTQSPLQITINNVVQPSSVQDISGFSLDVFYSSDADKVATGASVNSISLTPGSVGVASISSSSAVTADDPVQYKLSFMSQNTIPANGKVVITVPTDEITLNAGGTCSINGVTETCSTSGNDIIVSTSSELTAPLQINVTYSSLRNPSTTRQSSNFTFQTFNSADELIDTLGDVSLTVTMSTPSALTGTLSRSSKQNSQITTYSIAFVQHQMLQNSSKAIITIPSEVVIGSISCISQNAVSLPCSASANVITVQLDVQFQQDYTYTVTIDELQNPVSLQPTSSITIQTVTSDALYHFSQVTTGLQVTNTFSSQFLAFNFSFSNQYLAQSSILSIDIEQRDNVDKYVILLANSFTLGSIACFSSEFSPICDATGYQVTVTSGSGFPNVFTLNINGLTNPQSLPSDYTSITSYSANDFMISQNENTLIFTTACTFPCKQCTSTLSECTQCYPSSLTTQVYLFSAQCLSTCPSGYYENVLDLKCSACLIPCAECENENNYCTYCDLNTSYIYLNQTNTTSTCLSSCPTQMYADITQIPNLCVDCVSPCQKCSDLTTCESCVASYFLYGTDCLVTCPADVTLTVGQQCIDCSSQCATCAVITTNCTSCSTIAALYNGTCVLECPNNLIILSGQCVACDTQCRTCQTEIDNCTSCDSAGSFPNYFNFDCLATCPDYYYSDSFSDCQPCADLSRGCENCSSPSVCLSCDAGYVLLNNNCLDTVPAGYLNISGVAEACQGDCETCSLTLTNCTSCVTLNLFGNTCTSTCPSGTTSVNQICESCSYPCQQCSSQVTFCSSCQANSSTFLFNSDCVVAEDCPETTFGNVLTLECDSCISPCLDCNSSTECLSCVTSYFYLQESLSCVLTCPSGMVGVNKLCVNCTSPCQECQTTATRCTSCLSGYFFNSNTNECLNACPSGLIEDLTLMQCVSCQSPCKTCQNTTDTCLSCVSGTFLSFALCVTTCPDGEYGSSGLCLECDNNCTTCSSKSTCLSCSYPFYLYSSQCLEECPVTHAIASNNSVCISCETVMDGCSNCSQNGECYECFSPKIYFNTQCLDQCPSGYVYVDFTCEVETNTTTPQPDPRLVAQSIFPLPFTILGCVLFIACFLSKLQNTNTYLIGAAYSIWGFIETGCIVYLGVRYYLLGVTIYQWNMIILLLAVLGAIYLLNLLSFLTQTPLLCLDERFSQFLGLFCSNRSFFGVITTLSFLVNYKFKMILFTKLFNFYCMRAILDSVNKFRMFNIFSFFGLLYEGLCLYVCFISIFNFITGTEIFMWFVDTIIVVIINIILAIAVAWKKEDFFSEVDDEGGLILNKKFNADGQDFSKEALDHIQYEDTFINKDYDSYGPLQKDAGIISMSQSEYTASLQDEIGEKNKSKINVYFQRETSTPFRKQVNEYSDQKFNQTKAENIFQSSDKSREEEEEEKNKTQELGQQSLMSEGGSQKLILSPTKTAKTNKQVIVNKVEKIKTNNATVSEDISKKINQREEELDELRQEMLQKEKLRKQLRKQRKLMKKSIQPPSQPEQRKEEDNQESLYSQKIEKNGEEPSFHEAPYESLSIKESTVRQSQAQHQKDKSLEFKQNRAAKILDQEEPQFNQDEISLPKESKKGWLQMKVNEDMSDLPAFTTLHGNRQNEVVQEMTEQESLKQKQQQFQVIRNVRERNLRTENEEKERPEEHKSKTLDPKQQKNSPNKGNSIDNKSSNRSKNRSSSKNKKSRRGQKQESKNKSSLDREEENLKEQSIAPKRRTTENKESLNLSLENSQQNESLQGYYQYEDQRNRPITVTQTHNSGEPKQNNLMFKNSSSQNANNTTNAHMPYDYDQVNTDLEDRNNTRQNFYNLNLDNQGRQRTQSGLQDSQHEDEEINSKPVQAIKKKGMNSNEALLEILAKTDKQRQKTNPRRNLYFKDKQEEGSSRLKDSISYRAGVRQLQQPSLSHKKSLNHPLQTNKISIKDEEYSEQGKNSMISSQRNMSLNNPVFKKFNSKDISRDSDSNIDDIDFQNVSIKPSYIELLNNRDQQKIPRKPGTSSSSRAQYLNNTDSKLSKVGLQRMNLGNRTITGEDDDLREYYKVQNRQKKSIERKESKQKINSRSKDKKYRKSSSKEHAIQGKRMKHLQKIYLPKKV